MSALVEFLGARIAEDEAAARATARDADWEPWDRVVPATWTAVADGDDGARVFAHWDLSAPDRCSEHPHGGPNDCDDVPVAYIDVELGALPATADHIARQDPARVFAECKAKRAIVHLHRQLGDTVPNGWLDGRHAYLSYPEVAWTCDQCGPGDEWVEHPERDYRYPCDTLRALAVVYAGHPDYQDEWRP